MKKENKTYDTKFIEEAKDSVTLTYGEQFFSDEFEESINFETFDTANEKTYIYSMS